MDLKEIQSGLTGTMAFFGDKLQGSLSFLSDMKDAGVEKITALMNDILGFGPLIEMTGFEMTDVSMDIGIPPGIILSFAKIRDVEPGQIEQIIEENKDKEVFGIIVQALQKADGVQKSMNLSHYKFGGLTMKIGFPPDICLKFTKVKEA